MKKIGTIDIAFKDIRNDVYYYDLNVDILGKVTKVVLPRYHAFLGWIEIFGLPPQHEWVVLEDINGFTKEAELVIDEQIFSETVTYTPDQSRKMHMIEAVRTGNGMTERCAWTLSYEDAPNTVRSETHFEHGGGTYEATWATSILAPSDELLSDEQMFAEGQKEKRGEPDLRIRKTFTASGSVPPLYYTLFPITDLLDLTDIRGEMFEVGYLKKESAHEIDHVHGDWFKRFKTASYQFHIVESNYTSCTIARNGEEERIKNTYRKELFAL